jgi:hypothetical protein
VGLGEQVRGEEIAEVVKPFWQEVFIDCLFQGSKNHGKLLVVFS